MRESHDTAVASNVHLLQGPRVVAPAELAGVVEPAHGTVAEDNEMAMRRYRRTHQHGWSMMRPNSIGLMVIGVVLGLVTNSAAGLFKEETVAERFEQAMKKKAEYCKTHKIDPANRRCEILKIKPADPLATEEGRFAHAIKIPNPVPEDSGYQPGMTPEQYFDHLCKTEAGEFIYKTVENVEGLYMMRPREHASDYMQEHLYAIEDPYGYTDWETRDPQTIFVDPPWRVYSYLEVPLPLSGSSKVLGARYRRYSGYAQDKSPMLEEHVTDLKSRYGYTWRGISRPHDRESGIAGGELIVLDLQTNEVLGVRRGFIRSGGVQNNLTGIWWLSGQVCPTLRPDKRSQKDGHFTYWFLSKVLKPTAASVQGGSNAAR